MSPSSLHLGKYQIPLNEILRITRNFSSETLIGDGGFGMVYIGQLSEEWQKRTVAIKRLNRDGYQGNTEFQNELKMVSSFQHPNIITFVGYCDEASEKIIVYEYADNGSLDLHLQNPDKRRCITWVQRLEICLGVARGLKYLHSGLGEHNRVIHRDVKSANILLFDNLEAKLCDFGLSRFSARNQEETSQLLTKAAGTRYYMDPLYAERSRLKKESDVYSLGVVMFEMSSGTLVYQEKCFGDDAQPQYLIDVVRSYYDDEKKAVGLGKLIDPVIRDDIDMKSLQTFNKIAHECLSLKLNERPPMATIIRKIELALDIQLNHHKSPSIITTPSLDSFQIPLEEINLATLNFSQETLIGDYTYGAVHRGKLYGRWQNRTMAITRLYPISFQSEDKFNMELQMISSLHHQNISRFIGYCYKPNERIIVHEYAVNGSVADYLLYWKRKRHLTWAERLKISLGAARGLQCLHLALGEENEAIHGNINCGNIMLDETMEAKVSFFGLSKQGPTYQKPDKRFSDMHSFGVIMFELLRGRLASELDKYVEPETQMQDDYDNNELRQLIDGYIRDQIDSRCLNIFIEVSHMCIKVDKRRNKGRGIMRNKGSGTTAGFKMDEVVERIEDAADFEKK